MSELGCMLIGFGFGFWLVARERRACMRRVVREIQSRHATQARFRAQVEATEHLRRLYVKELARADELEQALARVRHRSELRALPN